MIPHAAAGMVNDEIAQRLEACELPATHGLPLSGWSTDDLVRHTCQSGLVASIWPTGLRGMLAAAGLNHPTTMLGASSSPLTRD